MREIDLTSVYGRIKEVEKLIERAERNGEIKEIEMQKITCRLADAIQIINKPTNH